MKRLYFNNEQEYEKWIDDTASCIWAVYDEDEYLCDVFDQDFQYLYGIGFLSETAEIIPQLTTEQTEMFRDNYGIDIIIIEKALRLTDRQQDAVRQYNEAVKRLKDAKVMCVFKPYDNIAAFNGELVQDVTFEEDCDLENTKRVCADYLEVIACPFGLVLSLFDETCFGVQFK